MAESVGAVHVELTTNTATFRAELAKAGTSVKTFSDDARRAADTAKSGGAAASGLGTKFGKLGDDVKGAAASVGGFSQAMSLMGSKVPPQIKGIGNAVSALAMGGFTPLGIAIGAVTTAIGFFASQSAEAAEAQKKMKDALADTRREAGSLKDELQALLDKQNESRGGAPSGEAALQRRIDAQRAVVLGIPSTLPGGKDLLAEQARLQSNLMAFQRAGLVHQADYVKRELEKIDAAAETLRAEKDKLATLEKQLAVLQEMRRDEEARKRGPLGSEVPAAGGEVATLGVPEGFMSSITPDTPGPSTALQDMLSDLREDFAFTITEGMEEAGPIAADQLADDIFETLKLRAELDTSWMGDGDQGVKLIPPEKVEEAKVELTGLQVLGQKTALSLSDSFGDAFGAFVSGATSAQQAMAQFAQSFIRDVTSMIAKAAVLYVVNNALGLGTGAVGGGGGATGSIGSAIFGGFKSAPSGGTAKSAMVPVTVHNYAGVEVSAASAPGMDGPEVEILIEKAAANALERDGPLSRALARRGVPRRGRMSG